MAPILVKREVPPHTEEWLRVNLSGTVGGDGGPDLVVVSGYAHYHPHEMVGSEDNDMVWVDYLAEILVGPIWLRLVDVSPTVTIAGYQSNEADEADMMAINVTRCTWEFPEPPEPRRIRLIVSLAIGGGENARIESLAYHLVARGKLVKDQNFKENT